MSEFARYRVLKSKHRRHEIVEMRPWVPGENLDGVALGTTPEPSPGDMIARNPNHHPQQWLVTVKQFTDGFEPA